MEMNVNSTHPKASNSKKMNGLKPLWWGDGREIVPCCGAVPS